jgi:hypothetical protein
LRPLRSGSPIFVRAVNQSSVKYGEELNIYPPVYGIDRNLDTHTFTDPSKTQQVWSLRFKTPLKLGSDQVAEDVQVPGNKRLLDLPESIRLGCVRLYQKRHFSDDKSGTGVTSCGSTAPATFWCGSRRSCSTVRRRGDQHRRRDGVGNPRHISAPANWYDLLCGGGAVTVAGLHHRSSLAASPPELLPIGNSVVFLLDMIASASARCRECLPVPTRLEQECPRALVKPSVATTQSMHVHIDLPLDRPRRLTDSHCDNRHRGGLACAHAERGECPIDRRAQQAKLQSNLLLPIQRQQGDNLRSVGG